MCGGFNCSKNALTALNILFLLVSFVLIGIASYAKAAAIITSFQIAGGIIACGLFLFLVSVLGLVAASKHHQVLLFFYFIILFLLFLVQFSVSIACLALSDAEITDLIGGAWHGSANETKDDAQTHFNCCGWNKTDADMNHCRNLSPPACPPKGECPTCSKVIPHQVSSMLIATGGVGFFFSLMELLGVYLAVRFRNQKDPRANPSQFL